MSVFNTCNSEGDDLCSVCYEKVISQPSSSTPTNNKINDKELSGVSVEGSNDKHGINSSSTIAVAQLSVQKPLPTLHKTSSLPLLVVAPLPTSPIVKSMSCDRLSLLPTKKVLTLLFSIHIVYLCACLLMQVETSFETEACISSKVEVIIEKHFKVKHPFLIERITSGIQQITKGSEIHSIGLVTAPYCAIGIKGTKAAVEQAESNILSYIKENVAIRTLQFTDYCIRPALRSPEMVQFCKQLCNEHAVSVKIQLLPEVVASAVITLDKSEVMVQICEGDVALDSTDAFVNFTDGNLTMSDEVKALLSKAEIERCECYVKKSGVQLPGKAVCFHRTRSNNKIIIHAVMPDCVDVNSSAVTSAVMESLKLAVHYEAASISLPFFSCVDDCLSLDLLAESCLSGIHKFAISQLSNTVRMIRLVLPVNMTERFKYKFTSGIFKEFIVADELDIVESDCVQKFCGLGDSAWLWEDDKGIYNYFSPEDSKLLSRENANQSLSKVKIGPYFCVVDFKTMTQTNACTQKKRKVINISLACVWQFRNHEEKWKWEEFSPQVSLMIEAMYLTGNENRLTVNNQVYAYDFNRMVQLNVLSNQESKIRRVSDSASFDDSKSKITISGFAADITIVEEKLLQCLKSLVTVHSVDVQSNLIPTLERCMRQIQRSNVVEVVKMSESDDMAKYDVIGEKDHVQKAVIEIYKATMTSCAVMHKPFEWEPQNKSVELKDILIGSPEWSKIFSLMRMTIRQCNLISVKRIQNEYLWEKYVQHKELMGRKGGKSATEMELFHGTRTTPPERIYESEEGFDMRYSRQGLWGLGNYFAVAANYTSTYAYKDASGILQVFLVKVLVGDSCELPQDYSLRMPPFKPDGTVRYNTVTGVSYGHRIYVTYSNDKAYPFYLISYTV